MNDPHSLSVDAPTILELSEKFPSDSQDIAAYDY